MLFRACFALQFMWSLFPWFTKIMQLHSLTNDRTLAQPDGAIATKSIEISQWGWSWSSDCRLKIQITKTSDPLSDNNRLYLFCNYGNAHPSIKINTKQRAFAIVNYWQSSKVTLQSLNDFHVSIAFVYSLCLQAFNGMASQTRSRLLSMSITVSIVVDTEWMNEPGERQIAATKGEQLS